MKVIHGSKVKQIQYLSPQFIAGANGSQDGVGVNLTDNIDLALRYATDKGSIYLVDLNVDDFLTVSDNVRLTESQSKTLIAEFSELDERLQYRFATDLCGKETHVFDHNDKAEEFYKLERLRIKGLDLGLDRMMPEIDDNDMESFSILTARKDFDLTDVSTQHIHYCLNLYDNQLATYLLNTISKGLILERESGQNNYLSFRPSEKVHAELTGGFLKRGDCNDLIKRVCESNITISESSEDSTIHSI